MPTSPEMLHDGYPSAQSSLQSLLNAQPPKSRTRKRSASCPPRIGDPSLDDLIYRMEDLSMELPHSDAVEEPCSPCAQKQSAGHAARSQDVSGITPENAQTLLDPAACLFVANLPIQISDREIQLALTQFLTIEGRQNFVKVHRMRSGVPFAHVQYLEVATAKEILETKNHRLLWNRQLRIEPASASRFLYVGHRDQRLNAPTEGEIRKLFAHFDVDSVQEPTEDEISRLGKCVLVHFAKWGECGEALRAHREDGAYWMKGPKKSPVADYHHAKLYERQLSLQASLSSTMLPFTAWTSDFMSKMPTCYPVYKHFSPAQLDRRPTKRRKHDHRTMDALPQPRYIQRC
ncbi:uncharacterized protein PV09_01792 [Verruconis gallopava]|uniref:RRM domain-containing protein n=1 Tax=Verruconis gallopava TaxID=253628 RepID=A0A0D2B9F7_9PEZI|nr:uncharacterized protein PV09_01792 [Verruconis gallopava]KIW07879.1 hypothetical protein PV09_01792 [Verruconis gallopava]